MKILFIGDIYGEPGRRILLQNIEKLKTEYKPNLIIINAENSAHGRGITKKIYKDLMSAGVNLLTMVITHLLIRKFMIYLKMITLISLDQLTIQMLKVMGIKLLNTTIKKY